MTLIFREPLEIPRQLGEDEFETVRLNLHKILLEGIDDLPENHADNH